MSSSAHYELPPLPSAPAPSSSSPQSQTSDVLLFDESDGGNIEIINGVVTMSNGLATAAYLSLFGGNEDDSGLKADDAKQYWGNLSETDPSKQYRSRTQNILRSLTATPANMLRVEDAVNADLAWMISSGVASAITANASMPARNSLKLDINITVSGSVYPLSFTMPWGANG